MKKSSSRIAREGYPFLVPPLCLLVLGWAVHMPWLLWTGCGLFAAIAAFFRDPSRVIPAGPGLVVAPADGKIVAIEEIAAAPFVNKPMRRVSIFLSIFNVHINRLPVAGTIKHLAYHAGKFFVASFEKASEQNERHVIHMEDEAGRDIIVTQIAGLVARRIVSYLHEGDRVARGKRFGLIRFGSRVDLYLPLDCELLVKRGDRVCGGSSLMGRFS
ncbi:MAG: phosphatidylserine decarboxylase family protein [Deltaproteobacteria bacterium]|nr:phosphatidylserine decarboxylase family protein [Deltaproteobacteria bacterium]